MKLENYLIEDEKGLDHYVPKIEAECKPFLKDIRNAAGTLFRDDTKNRHKPIWKKVTRLDRAPLDSPKEIHDELDLWFEDKFGWRARSEGLFCWPIKFKSDFIMGKWLVFPAGNYKYLWSDKVIDLWSTLSGDMRASTEDMIKGFETLYGDSYTNKNIKKSIMSGHEVMINCKYSYLARAELMEPLNDMLGLNWQGAVYKGRKIV